MMTDIELAEVQRRAVESNARLVSVKASAGTGKTRVLVARYIYLLEKYKPDIDKIVAVTFTRNATAEMRERIKEMVFQKLLHSRVEDRDFWRKTYRKIDTARISTFHSFYAEILRKYAFDAGLDPEFTIMEDSNISNQIFFDIYIDVISKLKEKSDDKLARLMNYFEPIQIYNNYMKTLYNTRDKLYRLYNFKEIDPERIIINLKAIKELKEKLPLCYVSSHEWRILERRASVLLEYIKKIPKLDAKRTYLLEQLVAKADMLLDLGKYIRDQKKKISIEKFLEYIKSIKVAVRNIEKKFERYVDVLRLHRLLNKEYLDDIYKKLKDLIKDEGEEKNEEMEAILRNLLYLYKIYERAINDYKDQNSAVDFLDLPLKTRSLITQKPAILEYIRSGIDHILVDEFQDTDLVQLDILTAIAGIDGRTNITQKYTTLFLVGDEKQSIYRFRGADVTVTQIIERRLVNFKDYECHNINTNYRSTGNLVDFQNYIFSEILGGPDTIDYECIYKNVEKHIPDSEQISIEFISHEKTQNYKTESTSLQPDNFDYIGEKAEGSYITSLRNLEARAIAHKIKELVDIEKFLINDDGKTQTIEYRDIALLFNTMTGFGIYEQELIRNAIPYHTVVIKDFFQRPEIYDLINLLNAIDNPENDFNLISILRSPLFGINDDTIFRIHTLKGKIPLWTLLKENKQLEIQDENQYHLLQRAIDKLSFLIKSKGLFELKDLISLILRSTYYNEIYLTIQGEKERLENINSFCNQYLNGLYATGIGTINELINELNRSIEKNIQVDIEKDANIDENSIWISTIHKAKGLEFPVVFLPNLAQGKRHSQPLIINTELGIALKYPLYSPGDYKNRDAKSNIYKLLLNEEQRMETAEKKRLFYVGTTRAKNYLVYSGARTSGSSELIRFLDRFLEEDLYQEELPEEIEKITNRYSCDAIKGEQDDLIFTHETFNPDIFADEILNLDINIIQPLLFSLKHKKIFYPSELPDYTECPRLYFLRHIDPAPEEPIEATGLPITGKEFGSLVHNILARYNGKMPPDSIFNLYNLKDDQIKIIKGDLEIILANYRSSRIYADLNAAREKHHEFKFIYRLRDVLIDGAIDLLILNDKGFQIVDFKTDRIPDEGIEHLTEHYKPQMECYAIGIKKLFNQDIIPYSLLFLRNGKIVDISLNADELRIAEERICSLIDKIRSDTKWEKSANSHHRCPYRKLCGF